MTFVLGSFLFFYCEQWRGNKDKKTSVEIPVFCVCVWTRLFFSILLVQFGDELQIAARQIRFDPAVDVFVRFRVDVVLPVASFACRWTENVLQVSIFRDNWMLPLRQKRPLSFMKPCCLPISKLTASFREKLSKRRCSVSRVNCSSVSGFCKKSPTRLIPPRKSYFFCL